MWLKRPGQQKRAALTEAEADRLCSAQRYERSEARPHTRASHCERKLQTKAGRSSYGYPKLRAQRFETPIIERTGGVRARSRRHAPGRGHHRGLMGCGMSLSTVLDLNKKIYGTIEA
jgi:hypothetical protein